MTINSGTRLSHYEILGPIGAGGMGEVFLAQDTKLHRSIAIKLLADEFNKDPDRLDRFIREARAASALNHPNILTIYEVGETDGKHYIATEFIDGETLRHCIQQHKLTTRDTVEVILQVASALTAAHQAGVIHRDVKPENIMLRPDGIAKVLDFGLAKLTERQPLTTDTRAATLAKKETDPGTVMGTVQYMSPEQARGKAVDARTDVFSLGVVLYEAIAGRAPFAGESSTDVLAAILEKEPLPLARFAPDLPQELQRIVNKSLRKKPDDRYQTMRDFLLDLKELRDELALEAKLERSVGPTGVSAENQRTVIADGVITKDAGLRTSSTSLVQTTSSAEYLVSQIQQHKRGVLAGSLVVFFAVLGLGYLLLWNRAATNKQIDSIAVMPFVNESGNADLEYLSDGMTETLIRSLSQLPNLNVKARSSAFRYKGKETDAKTIGKELGVQAILNGRVVQRGEQLTLNLELIDAQTENLIWTDQYDRKSSDLVALQNLIARDVSSKLKIKLSGADLEKLAKNYTNDPEAYRLYLQGRFYWNKRVGKEFELSEGYFRQAVGRDPNFALGYVGLADFQEDADRPRKKEYIRRALELDDKLAEAHASLGYQYMLDYNWVESERELKRAMELNPNYAQAHQWNGARLFMLGKYDESLASINRALEIDPTSPGINFYLGVCLMASGKTDQSIEQFKKLIAMEPEFTWTYRWLTRAYRWAGNHAAEVEARARALEVSGDKQEAKLIRDSFATGGWNGYLRELVRNGQGGFPVSSQLGEATELDREKAIQGFMRQAETGNFWLFLLKIEPGFEPLRADPRIQEIIKKFEPPQ